MDNGAVSRSGKRHHSATQTGVAENGQLMIRKSHQRSETFGLDASTQPDYDVLLASDLTLKLDQNRLLCSHALPVMETLYEQIINTHSMIVLTDADGLILHSLGDDDFLQRADKVALRAGALWSEQRQGTNAIGTAIAECEATTVRGNQHYLRANRFLACSSVPIFNPFGNLMGVLDVTGDCRSHHQHTMALAKMSGQVIENNLFSSTFVEALRIHFHSRPEFIGTLMEGIAAFDTDGRFLSANRSAQFQLGMPLSALYAHTLSSLFNLSSGELLDSMRRGSTHHQMHVLCMHNGVKVFAKVKFRRSNGVALNTIGVTSPVLEPKLKLTGLRYLETGDVQVGDLISRVRKVMGRPIPILIGGETGSGKEVLASAIHSDSPRSRYAFVAVNCASIPGTLIEAELFGYVPGAFTGAAKGGGIGKIIQADGGTLFLDEIGDMPFALQSRLLRVLQERTVTPLGATKAVPVDFALVCASNRNLREMVLRGEFRDDLYYRINGLLVTLPPLRERTDLASTVDKILRSEAYAGRPVMVAPEVLAMFARYPWPGNFRQLSNVLRTACAMLDDGESIICMTHLPRDFLDEFSDSGAIAMNSTAFSAAPATAARLSPTSLRLQDLASSAVIAALAAHGGNVSAAARTLGVSRNTLYRKMTAIGALKKLN